MGPPSLQLQCRAGLAALLAAAGCACAQPADRAVPPAAAASTPDPAAPDPGMVTRPPPDIDPHSLGAPPAHVDPGIVAPTPAPGASSAAPSQVLPKRGESRQDDCRGPAALCKQDSAR